MPYYAKSEQNQLIWPAGLLKLFSEMSAVNVHRVNTAESVNTGITVKILQKSKSNLFVEKKIKRRVTENFIVGFGIAFIE